MAIVSALQSMAFLFLITRLWYNEKVAMQPLVLSSLSPSILQMLLAKIPDSIKGENDEILYYP